MACISKLTSAIVYDCDSGATGLVSAIIINKSDIASYTVNANTANVSAVTLIGGATPYKIDTVKRSLVVSASLRVNDGAPNAYSHSASIIQTSNDSTAARTTLNDIANGSFVIMAKWAGRAVAEVYGLYYGLSATGVENNSHDNGGWTSITLETPENVIGEDTLRAADDVYASLLAAAVG